MPKRALQPRLPRFDLDSGRGFLHRRLYTALRKQIEAGEIASGDRLPSSRALASALRISRNTVVQAYERLTAEGILIARVGSGTRVSAAAEPIRFGEPPMQTAGIAAIFQRAHFPLRWVVFEDCEHNAFRLYDSSV
jgi:GntR family transcriptional regulator/MocR family aminotransferase